MKHDDAPMNMVEIQPLTADGFDPFGWLLGKTISLGCGVAAFRSADLDFREEHVFDPGAGGETEVLWVNYRNRRREVSSLEVHRLTQQAVVPLTGEIIQVVALSEPDGSPDIRSLRAFRIRVGEGVCMRPGCWHTTRVDSPEVTCLMLTRRSTTIDLTGHLTNGSSLLESAIATVEQRTLTSIGE